MTRRYESGIGLGLAAAVIGSSSSVVEASCVRAFQAGRPRTRAASRPPSTSTTIGEALDPTIPRRMLARFRPGRRANPGHLATERTTILWVGSDEKPEGALNRPEPANVPVDRMGLDPGWRTSDAGARRPGARLVLLSDERTSAAGSAAANSCTGRPGKSAGVHLAHPRSDVGPRCASLSGLAIALMLVI